MRRASLLIGLLLLTACTQTPEKTNTGLIDKAYVSTVREEVDTLMSNDEIIRIGKDTCKTEDLFEAIQVIEDEGFTESDAAYIVGAGWGAYCPDHTEKYK
jgi:hypothetical protein